MSDFLAGVRSVFLDAVGTLIVPDPPAIAVYARTAARLGLLLTEATIATRFHQAFQQEEHTGEVNGWRTSEPREFERWRQIVHAVFHDVGNDAQRAECFQELYSHFAHPQAWRLAEGGEEVVKGLAAMGFTLGIASNFDRRLHPILDGLPGLKLLPLRIVSSEVGWRKPARQFFAAMTAAVGCAPQEILHVGDSKMNDYDGAIAAGLQAVLVDPGPANPGTRRINGLTELLPRSHTE